MHQGAAQSFSEEDWNKYAECYDTLLGLTPYRALVREVASLLGSVDSDCILDAGCGTGNLLFLLAQSSTAKLYGVDMSPHMLSRASHKLEGRETHLICTSLDTPLQFDAGTFSKVASINVLYALPDPVRTLTELYRVMRHGGRLVLVTPKKGYENGLILKEHAGSDRGDTYWQNAHASPEREEMLLREALRDETLISAMLIVAQFNRVIARNARFHFFDEPGLLECATKAGFTNMSVAYTYAKQSLLLTAEKE